MLRERDVPREKVEWIKDGPQKDLLGRYTTFSWTSLCEAVLKIGEIERRQPQDALALTSGLTS
jgi:hypothetical protein